MAIRTQRRKAFCSCRQIKQISMFHVETDRLSIDSHMLILDMILLIIAPLTYDQAFVFHSLNLYIHEYRGILIRTFDLSVNQRTPALR